jgi:hypothetical protein
VDAHVPQRSSLGRLTHLVLRFLRSAAKTPDCGAPAGLSAFDVGGYAFDDRDPPAGRLVWRRRIAWATRAIRR